MRYLRRHIIQDPVFMLAPLVRTSCGATGAPCNHNTLSHPSRPRNRGQNPLPLNNQHTHTRAPTNPLVQNAKRMEFGVEVRNCTATGSRQKGFSGPSTA
ncbi:hypothetical protein BJV82DRAFT_584994, partial [Fennellomyces sp. T-0311]